MKNIKLTLLIIVILIINIRISLSQHLRPTNLNKNTAVEFNDGDEYIVSKTKNSIVAVNAKYKRKELTFFVVCQNKTNRPINVAASNLFVNGESKRGEKISLKVYSYDEYVQRLVKRANAASVFGAVVVGLDQGLNEKTQAQKDKEIRDLEARNTQIYKSAEEKASYLLKNTTLTKYDEFVKGQIKVKNNRLYSHKIYLYIPVGTETHEICYIRSRKKPKKKRIVKTIEDNYYNNGLTKYNNKNYDDAISDFSKYIKLKPNETKGYYARGICKMEREDYEGALSDFDQALIIDPTDINTLKAHGGIYYNIKDYKAAIRDYSKIIKIYPDSVNAYYLRANAEIKRKKNRNAINDFTIAIKLEPNNFVGYYYRADTKYAIDDIKGAIKDYSKAIKIYPTLVLLYYKRAIIKYRNYGLGLARNDFKKIIQLENKSGTFVWKPFALHYLGKKNEAIKLMKSIVVNENKAINHYNLACLYSLQNNIQGGIESLSTALNKGYSDFDWIIRDEDMDNIKYNNEFNTLLLKYGVNHKFTPQEYVQKYVENRIIVWQQKGKYEKTSDYKQRVNEKTRNKKIKILKKQAITIFKKKYLVGINWKNLSIEGYDADSETFRIRQEKVGVFIINVPIKDAEYFENNYESLHYSKADVLLKDESIILSYLVVKNTQKKKTWVYDITKQVNYNPTEFIVNFDKVEAGLPSFNKKTKGNNKKIIIGKSDVDENLPNTKTSNSSAIAVVIGNKNYKKTRHVDYAHNDANSVKTYLIKCLGYKKGNIIYMEDATLGEFNTLFGTKDNHKGQLYNTIKQGVSDVFIYYSGHGAPDLETKSAYFVPVECAPNYINTGGYSIDILYSNLSKLNAKSVTIVTDACFSGAIFKNISPIGIEAISPIATIPNCAILSSSSGSEVSSWYTEKQHGMFTYFFLKAIQDRKSSDKNKDKKLTISEIYEYINNFSEGVPYFARLLHNVKQNPTLQGNSVKYGKSKSYKKPKSYKNRVLVKYK